MKSNAGRRKVPIPAALRDHLVEHKIATDREGAQLMFGRTAQDPFTPNGLQERADAAWRDVGLNRLTPHTCRHTFASLMIAAGVNAKALQTFMGHANISITFDRYGHLMPGSEEQAASGPAAALRPKSRAADGGTMRVRSSDTTRAEARPKSPPAPNFRCLAMAEQMYIIIVGAGKVGWNLARELLEKGSEVTLIENNRERYLTVEQELEHNIQYGDASELWVLERAGISRADMVIAVTGDDEDNILICQVAKEKYLVDRIIARVNNPRNREHFELLGIRPVVSATDLILRLIEHEVPEYGLVHLLDLPEQRLEIIEILLPSDSKAAGQRVGDLQMPEGALLISVLRDDTGFVPNSETVLEAGDEILAVLDPTVEEDVTARFGSDSPAATTP